MPPAVSDSKIVVNVSATDNDFLSDMSAPLVGSFMGNKPTTSSFDSSISGDPNTTRQAYQEINTDALGNMDNINGKEGQTTLHEVTEAYYEQELLRTVIFNLYLKLLEPIVVIPIVFIVLLMIELYNNREHFYNSQGQEVVRGTSNFQPVRLRYSTGNNQIFHTVPKKR